MYAVKNPYPATVYLISSHSNLICWKNIILQLIKNIKEKIKSF